jgi:hypothetical protein
MRAEGRAAVPRRRRIALPLRPDRAVPASRGMPPLLLPPPAQPSRPPPTSRDVPVKISTSSTRELAATCDMYFTVFLIIIRAKLGERYQRETEEDAVVFFPAKYSHHDGCESCSLLTNRVFKN